MKGFLRIVNGPNAGQFHSIPEGGTRLVGRASDVDWRLEDSLISRHHCALWLRSGRLFIRDLNSRNGTFINEQRLEPEPDLHSIEHPHPHRDRQWHPGERLIVGENEIELVIEDRPESDTEENRSRAWDALNPNLLTVAVTEHKPLTAPLLTDTDTCQLIIPQTFKPQFAIPQEPPRVMKSADKDARKQRK